MVTDRLGQKNVPFVAKQPRHRTKTGKWRNKRIDSAWNKKKEEAVK